LFQYFASLESKNHLTMRTCTSKLILYLAQVCFSQWINKSHHFIWSNSKTYCSNNENNFYADL